MTGFGRSNGNVAGVSWNWELRSVNSRGLEVRFRLPVGCDRVEAECRKRLSGRVTRGAVSCLLTTATVSGPSSFNVNREALEVALEAIASVRSRIETAPPRPEAILALRGVLEGANPELVLDDDVIVDGFIKGFDAALEALVNARLEEGASLRSIVTAQLFEIDRLVSAAEKLAGTTATALKDRLAAQLRELIEVEKLAPERLAQEAALLAVKADVREELDRLRAHVISARDLIARPGAAGRKLDFLTQEFNREANTLCAKAPNLELKQIGLDLKAVIDQLREQAQNVE
ncbi:MAG: YicC family protein [Alphaproteobacteria bacterium]|nr:YicC family protein [Alphaproteobacteria bacterium]